MKTGQNKVLRVLLIAEACNPEWTSVPLVGYNIAKAISMLPAVEATVVTHPRNREALGRSDLREHARIEYADNDYVAGRLFRLAQVFRGGGGKGWTTNTAFSSISYLFFEREVFKLFRAGLAARDFDIIHRVTPVTPTAGSPLAAWTDVPMILGPLNGGLPWPKEYPDLRKRENEFLVPLRQAYKLLPYYKKTYRRVRAVLAGSRHTASEVPAWFCGKRVLLPENGVDPERFEIAEKWCPPSEKFRFIAVGRLVPYKGLWLTLSAMRGSEVLKDCELVVVGDGPERPALEKMARDYGLSGRVKWLGHLDQKSVSREMRRSQCFVFPSLREFGGGVVLEAMACGLPSVVVDYGGPQDLIDAGCGILLPMAEEKPMVAALRAAMEKLVLSPELCEEFSKNATRRIREDFLWSKKAEKILAIYREILA